MRKLIFAINLTLDGCCDHTKLGTSDEIYEYYSHLMRDVDLFVYGRKTYQLMVPFWPDVAKNHLGQTEAMNEFARVFDSKNILVFSQSLAGDEGPKTRIVHTKLEDEILRLKQAPGKDILTGGVSIPSQLIELGLVDEFRVVVQPIIAGEGRRLLTDLSLPERLQLGLVESKVFASGFVALHYRQQ